MLEKVKKLVKFRFWNKPGEKPSLVLERARERRLNYENLSYEEYIEQLEEYNKTLMRDSMVNTKDREKLQHLMAQKIHACRYFLKREETIAACKSLHPITNWYKNNRMIIPVDIEALVIEAMAIDASRTFV